MYYKLTEALACSDGIAELVAGGVNAKVKIESLGHSIFEPPTFEGHIIAPCGDSSYMDSRTLRCLRIVNVIFNDPATIIFWNDGSKTVVKCKKDEVFDPEKGLAMAIAKKALGNQGNYYNEFKKWADKYVRDSEITE